MRHPADRLAALSDPAFAAFVERLGRIWPAFDVTGAPATPGGTVELSLVRERSDRPPERAVVRVTRARVTVADVDDFAVLAAERGLSFAVLASVDEVDPDAMSRARAAPVDVYDGVGIVGRARDADVALPEPGGRGCGDDEDGG